MLTKLNLVAGSLSLVAGWIVAVLPPPEGSLELTNTPPVQLEDCYLGLGGPHTWNSGGAGRPTIVDPRRRGTAGEHGLWSGGRMGPDVVAYAALRSALVEGCTPILRIWAGGDITFYGCPTLACAPGQGNCQVDGSDSDETLSCYCEDGNVLCKGVAVLDEGALVIGWYCFKVDCAVACTTVAAPPAPPTGHTAFFACDC